MLSQMLRSSSRTLCRPRQIKDIVCKVPIVAACGNRVCVSMLSATRSFSATARVQQQNQPMRVGEKIANLKPAARKLDILFLTNAHNSMSQRANLELTAMGHEVTVELALSEKQMMAVVDQHKPDLIVGPFLTKYVNEAIWKKYPTLIVHPGIHGDRGASAIDWALQQKAPEWGVTVLSAAEEMDAGDIWSSVNFPVKRNVNTGVITKSSLYGNEVINAGMQALKEALHKYLHDIPPTPLDYSDPAVLGTLNPTMKQKVRAINWTADAAEIVNRVAAADGQPGVLDKVAGENVFLFGAHVEAELNAKGDFEPRSLIARRDEAVCIATGNNGAVWITHMKKKNADGKQFLKLPATRALGSSVAHLPEVTANLMDPHCPKSSWREIWTQVTDGVCYLHFDFHNGAMNTEQCARLVEAIKEVKQHKDIKVLVLMGGYSYFSNGIHLNTIEASADPAEESLKNINGINDVVLEVMDSPELITVSAIRGKAGAGGVMMALGADHVHTHEATILNPHYRSMGLFGSEYWTYNLPLRVGEDKAKEITESCQALSGKQAQKLGMVDVVMGRNVEEFDSNIRLFAQMMGNRSDIDSMIEAKKEKLTPEWRQLVGRHRRRELSIMKENFRDDVYITAREGFVYKKKPLATPQHLVKGKSVGKIMNGKLISQLKRKAMANTIAEIKETHNTVPGLAVLMMKGDEASALYVKSQQKLAIKAGFKSVVEIFDPETTPNVMEVMAKRVDELNVDQTIDGVMIQLPFPAGMDSSVVTKRLDVSKDVDALNPHHLGVMCTNFHAKDTYFTPCTAKGIIELMSSYDIKLAGKKVVVIGASQVVGLPVALMLSKQGATVQICHQHTIDLENHVRAADIVVSATGAPHLVKSSWIKTGAVVMDAGIAYIDDPATGESYVTGDVEKAAAKKASFITPVPGGVGPMTVCTLMENTMQSFQRKLKAQAKVATDMDQMQSAEASKQFA